MWFHNLQFGSAIVFFFGNLFNLSMFKLTFAVLLFFMPFKVTKSHEDRPFNFLISHLDPSSNSLPEVPVKL